MNANDPFNLPKKIVPIILGVIVLIIFLSKSIVTIGAGEAGVLWKRFDGGVVINQPPIGEGFHVIAPWNDVVVYQVRQQEIFEKMKVLSSNGLDITLEMTAWFQPKYSELGNLHQQKGILYKESVIGPVLRSVARSIVGRYTPEQLYSTKRDTIQLEIFKESKIILDGQYVQLNEVLVRDVTLPPTIKEAIERKLKQEQESLEYKFRIEKSQKEAERQVIEAQGKADANRILSASLTDKILQDKGIDATLQLANSANSKVIVIGSSKDGLPIILGNQ